MTRTLHVLALPHTTLTERDSTCAYSQKVKKFVTMMRRQDARVVLYGPDLIECEPSEHVVVHTEEDRERWGFGGGYDTARGPFEWDTAQPYWQETNARMIAALRERLERRAQAMRHRDIVCLVTATQHPVAEAVCGPGYNNPLAVEWAVGYEGWCSPFRAYESYAWMHHVYGLWGWRNGNGKQFDRVIPNFFDPDEFTDPADKPDDYLLFIGRFIPNKGVAVAADIARRAGRRLLVAGPGVTEWSEGTISCPEVTIEGDVHYVGQVGYQERATLMANAYAVLVPTLYVEPFGGVAVEAMMCGTPVLASDWGSFTEIVTPDVGRRFRTLRDADQALDEIADLDRSRIRTRAIGRYGLNAVGPQFTRWFDALDTLWQDGYYA